MVRLNDISEPERAHLLTEDVPRYATTPWVEGPPPARRRVALVTTDGDGLWDHLEYDYLHGDPLKADTDQDGLSDGEEWSKGTDPWDVDTTTAYTTMSTPCPWSPEAEEVRRCAGGRPRRR